MEAREARSVEDGFAHPRNRVLKTAKTHLLAKSARTSAKGLNVASQQTGHPACQSSVRLAAWPNPNM